MTNPNAPLIEERSRKACRPEPNYSERVPWQRTALDGIGGVDAIDVGEKAPVVLAGGDVEGES